MAEEAAVVSVVQIQMIYFECFSAEERVLSNCLKFENHKYYLNIMILYFINLING